MNYMRRFLRQSFLLGLLCVFSATALMPGFAVVHAQNGSSNSGGGATNAIGGGVASVATCFGAGGLLSGAVSAAAAALTVPVNDAQANTVETSELTVQCVLKGFAVMAREILIKKLTASIVEWINTGFEGNPTFVTDIDQLLLDTADEAFGEFIYNDENFRYLCSPWQAQIRLAIATGYANSGRFQARCTLSEVALNAQNAFNVQDFITITTTSGGNPFSAYLELSRGLQDTLDAVTQNKRDEVQRNQGFLDFTICDDVIEELGAPGENPADLQARTGSATSKRQKCTVQTPGTVINEQLNDALESELGRFELADEFNEIFAALVNLLIQKVLGPGGLLSVSQRTNGSRSFLDDFASDNVSNPQLVGQKSDLEFQLDQYEENIDAYISLKTQTLAAIVSGQEIIEGAQTCYLSKHDTFIRLSNRTIIDPEDLDTVPAAERERATFFKIEQNGGDTFRVFLSPDEALRRSDDLLPIVSEYEDDAEQIIAQIDSAEDGLVSVAALRAELDPIASGENPGEEDLALLLDIYGRAQRELPNFDISTANTEVRLVGDKIREDLDGPFNFQTGQNQGGGFRGELVECQSFSTVYNPDIHDDDGNEGNTRDDRDGE